MIYLIDNIMSSNIDWMDGCYKEIGKRVSNVALLCYCTL